MASYIVKHTQDARVVEPITFMQEDVVSPYYPHCEALVVRAMISQMG